MVGIDVRDDGIELLGRVSTWEVSLESLRGEVRGKLTGRCEILDIRIKNLVWLVFPLVVVDRWRRRRRKVKERERKAVWAGRRKFDVVVGVE